MEAGVAYHEYSILWVQHTIDGSSQRLLFTSCIRVWPCAVLRTESSYTAAIIMTHQPAPLSRSGHTDAAMGGPAVASPPRSALPMALPTRGAGFGDPRGLAGGREEGRAATSFISWSLPRSKTNLWGWPPQRSHPALCRPAQLLGEPTSGNRPVLVRACT